MPAYPFLDPDLECLTLRGVALRGEFIERADDLPRGYELTSCGVPLRFVHPRQDGVVGDAAVTVVDGDLHVEARVHPDHVTHLAGLPYLAAALHVTEDEPAAVAFIFPSNQPDDPLQEPYRLTHVPEALLDHPALRGYERILVIDEAHEVSLGFNERGRVQAYPDEAKAHREWRSPEVHRRQNLRDAVARGLGYATWDELTGEGLERNQELARRVLTEVSRVR